MYITMAVEDELTFRYDNQTQLKQLTEILSNYSIELSAGAHAVVPEDFSKLYEKVLTKSQTQRHFDPTDSRDVQQRDEEIKELRKLTKEITQYSKKLKVFPFTSLKLDGTSKSPNIEHKFPYYDRRHTDEYSEEDLAHFLDSNPLNIVNDNFRFCSIWVDCIRGRKDIMLAKNVLTNLNEDQYKIGWINARLNPYDYTSDHYCDETSDNGSLHTEKGLVIITRMKIGKDSQNKLIENINKIGMKQQE